MPESRKLHGRIYTYSRPWGHFVGPVYLRSILYRLYQMYFVALMGHFKTTHPTFAPHSKDKRTLNPKECKVGLGLDVPFHFLLDLPVFLSVSSLSQVKLRKRKRRVQHKLKRQKRDKDCYRTYIYNHRCLTRERH